MTKTIATLLLFVVSLVTIGCGKDVPTFSVLPEENKFVGSNGTESITKIDILWVIDNSGSMSTSQTNLRDNFTSFINKFIANNYDFQMAVTTTDAYKSYFYPAYEAQYAQFKEKDTGVRIITKDTPDPVGVFMSNVMQGTSGSGIERALASLEESITSPLNSGFIREDSFLAVIIVSDEDDFSTLNSYSWGPNGETGAELDPFYNHSNIIPVSHYYDLLQSLKPGSATSSNFNVSAMAIWDDECRDDLNDSWPGRKIGRRYGELVDLTGGLKGDLCGDFANDLELMSDNILTAATEYPLDRTPKPETIIVSMDGEIVPKASENPGPTTGGWTYNEVNNSITFSGDHFPQQGSIINVVFDALTLEE